jgi:hypothetical protein
MRAGAVARIGSEPAHFDDVARIAFGGLENFPAEILQFQAVQVEVLRGSLEQPPRLRPGERLDVKNVPRILKEPPQLT